MFEIGYAIIFQVDGLDLEGVSETLSKYGKIVDIYDDILGGDKPVKVVIIRCTLSNGLRLKWDFNCVSAEDNEYVLFPMENMEEKLKVLKYREEERKGA